VDPDGREITGGPDDPFGTSYGSSSNASKTPVPFKELFPGLAQKENKFPYKQDQSTSQSGSTATKASTTTKNPATATTTSTVASKIDNPFFSITAFSSTTVGEAGPVNFDLNTTTTASKNGITTETTEEFQFKNNSGTLGVFITPDNPTSPGVYLGPVAYSQGVSNTGATLTMSLSNNNQSAGATFELKPAGAMVILMLMFPATATSFSRAMPLYIY
jgi:hypothetical protein